MPKSINTDKILKELDRGTVEDQYSALALIKSHIQKNLETEQKIAEDKSNMLSSQIQKISTNGN